MPGPKIGDMAVVRLRINTTSMPAGMTHALFESMDNAISFSAQKNSVSSKKEVRITSVFQRPRSMPNMYKR